VAPRIYSVKDISVYYEGRTENIANRPQDISTNGTFVNTSQMFPEGAVLNLRFRLANTGVEIRTRSEVRYCLPGVASVSNSLAFPPMLSARSRAKCNSAGRGRAALASVSASSCNCALTGTGVRLDQRGSVPRLFYCFPI
jgi:hypothetical protein